MPNLQIHVIEHSDGNFAHTNNRELVDRYTESDKIESKLVLI